MTSGGILGDIFKKCIVCCYFKEKKGNLKMSVYFLEKKLIIL